MDVLHDMDHPAEEPVGNISTDTLNESSGNTASQAEAHLLVAVNVNSKCI
jgi:hypothetical protein